MPPLTFRARSKSVAILCEGRTVGAITYHAIGPGWRFRLHDGRAGRFHSEWPKAADECRAAWGAERQREDSADAPR